MNADFLRILIARCGRRPFASALIGTITGMVTYALLHIAGSSAWIESHPGLAAWVQAVGSVAALGWGAWLYRASLKDKAAEQENNKRAVITANIEVLKFAARLAKTISDIGREYIEENKCFGPTVLRRLDMIIETMQLAPVVETKDSFIVASMIAARATMESQKEACESFNQAVEQNVNGSDKIHIETILGFIEHYSVQINDDVNKLSEHYLG
ncbi:hypothetical protein [Caulobacter sp. Root1455]|uniref:hypothetical protein n=1 Tax=Caulobacter sp. Root1455 TaxID=1736465 RepID=UPI0012E34E95|nr:hypothetical protein [Caulobacter sp. Root1455]